MEHDVQGDDCGVSGGASEAGEGLTPLGAGLPVGLHGALREKGHTRGNLATTGPNGEEASIAPYEDEASVLRSFYDAVDQLGHVARDASALVARNAEHLALVKVANDRIERLVATNQVALDRLVELPAV